MTWEEAKQAMKEGKRVRQKYFCSEEFFEMRNGRIFAEDGCPMDNWYIGEDWQKEGFSIVNNK